MISVTCVLTVYPKNFGKYGQTFPILEQNLKNVIEEKLKNSNVSFNRENLNLDLESQIKTPKKVQGLEDASEYRSFFFDPSYKVSEDINDANQKVVVKKGTIINPLDRIQLSTGMIFIDGSNPKHVSWAKNLSNEMKWILVNGSPLELEEKENRPIFFDQDGFYTKKFNIKFLPASVIQEGNRLLIEEWPLNMLYRE